ncbi:uncharacterized protein LOC143283722 [Babylonia areolata]|uniref:uncharacterized protein LOC143283722 n=1 Tax=Babylonia areolata TaxID=304850 RepID=UPI003FD3F0D4
MAAEPTPHKSPAASREEVSGAAQEANSTLLPTAKPTTPAETKPTTQEPQTPLVASPVVAGDSNSAQTSPADKPLPTLKLHVPANPEPTSEPSTVELILSARAAGELRARKEAEAAGVVLEEEKSPPRTPNGPLRLPHLREPTKEPEPTDPDFTVRLGAFMERAGDDCFPRLLQKEFPEPKSPATRSLQLLERSPRSHLSSTTTTTLTPTSPLSPLSPAVSPREPRWSTSSQDGGVVKGAGRGSPGGSRRPSLTGVRSRGRRQSWQLGRGNRGKGGGDQLLPLAPSAVLPATGSYITESESSYARFQRVARVVKIIVRVCGFLKSFVERNDSEGWSFVEMYLHVQQDMRQDLAFNPHHFTRAQPLNGGPRLEKLLSVPPQQRTAHHVQQIMGIIRGHSGFSDFPVHVQIQMCRVMRYELYESRRILLRQGHQPTAFYILLTGSLMVNIRDVHPSTGHVFIRTVSDLKEGDCFGELALLEQTPRTATIICKSSVELLSVAKEDFDRIIRRPLLVQRDSNIDLCRKHLLFQDFPCDVFYDNPEGFFFQHCPAGMTVVKNGQQCAYLVFVMSGKCHLIGSYSSGELTRKRLESASREVQKAFPLYTEVLKMADTGRKRPGTHPERSAVHDSMEVDLLTMVMGDRHAKTAVKAKRELGVPVHEYATPAPRPLLKSRTLSSFFDTLHRERRHRLMKSRDPGREALESFWACRLQGPVLCKHKHHKSKPDRGCTPMMVHNVDRLEFLRQEKEGFAQIALLSSGDVFGLETLVRRQASRVSVVSQGAELLFISKKLFLQHANIRVLRIVNDMSIIYPNAVDIHQQLQQRRQWSRYKHALVRHVVTREGRTYQQPVSTS